MKIVIDISEEARNALFDIANNGKDISMGLQNTVIMAIVNGIPYEKRPQKWKTIGGGEWVLKDHYWYLIAHKDYGTPMKAKYHSDCPHFTFFDANGERATYLFENKITHYMELPDIPVGAKE